jgi:hypothetical protein
MRRFAPILFLPLGVTACSSEAARELAACKLQLAAFEADREAFLAETTLGLGQLRAELETEDASLERMQKFAELQTGLDARENLIQAQQVRCNELARDQG